MAQAASDFSRQSSEVFLADLTAIDKIAPLFNQYRIFYNQPSNLPAALQFLTENYQLKRSLLFYIAADDQVLAFTQIYFQTSSIKMKRDLILNDLYVAPLWRKQGIARQLVTHVMNYAQSNEIRTVHLETNPTNIQAQSLYESISWISDKTLNKSGYYEYTWSPSR